MSPMLPWPVQSCTSLSMESQPKTRWKRSEEMVTVYFAPFLIWGRGGGAGRGRGRGRGEERGRGERGIGRGIRGGETERGRGRGRRGGRRNPFYTFKCYGSKINIIYKCKLQVMIESLL